jgi:hypothetical protein
LAWQGMVLFTMLDGIDIDVIYKPVASIMPRRLVYWCGVRIGTYATADRKEASELLFWEALKLWNERNGVEK